MLIVSWLCLLQLDITRYCSVCHLPGPLGLSPLLLLKQDKITLKYYLLPQSTVTWCFESWVFSPRLKCRKVLLQDQYTVGGFIFMSEGTLPIGCPAAGTSQTPEDCSSMTMSMSLWEVARWALYSRKKVMWQQTQVGKNVFLFLFFYITFVNRCKLMSDGGVELI